MHNVIIVGWQVHKIVDLSSFPSRDKLWRLEVTEAHHLFYNK
jgi:hypothetical protein